MAIEQLYTLQVACELIPMPSMGALYQFLHTNKDQFPARYRKTAWFEVRLLSESEILRIREMTLHDAAHSRYSVRAGSGNPLARILRQCAEASA